MAAADVVTEGQLSALSTEVATSIKSNKTALNGKADAVPGVPGTFWGVRTAAEWAALGPPTGPGPWWGIST